MKTQYSNFQIVFNLFHYVLQESFKERKDNYIIFLFPVSTFLNNLLPPTLFNQTPTWPQFSHGVVQGSCYFIWKLKIILTIFEIPYLIYINLDSTCMEVHLLIWINKDVYDMTIKNIKLDKYYTLNSVYFN